MRIQTSAREVALKALYQHDLLGGRPLQELRAFARREAAPDVAHIAVDLVEGCIENQDALDEVIRRTAENWKLERMATSDRNILRLGVYELLFRPETPPKVAINEAIELAKKYSTENSPTFVNGVLDKIYTTHVGTEDGAEPVPVQPERTGPPAPESRVDLHVHSTASDGSFEPRELPAMARKAGLTAFALTDHDSVQGVEQATAAGERLGVEVVPGVELTGYAPDAEGTGEVEVHVVGLWVDPASEVLLGRLAALRRARVDRVRRMSERLDMLGMSIDPDDVLDRADEGAVGRVHVAQELVSRGYCRDIGQAFDRYLNMDGPAYVAKAQMTPAEAVALVHRAGGCAVLSHPGLLPDGAAMARGLAEEGLDALEVHYPWHSDRDEKDLCDLAEELGLLVAGGSDFHGDAKPDINLAQETVCYADLTKLKERAQRYR